MEPAALLHKDDDLLALAKPAGVNTHRSADFAQDGIHEWAEARWGKLAIHHRLDKETSGVLIMARTPRGSKHLTGVFEGRGVVKRYAFLTRAAERPRELHCDDRIAKPRAGRAALDPRGAEAQTDFTVLERLGEYDLVEARPRTGRTHQVRLHAARLDMPILGDVTYGGARAARLFLHARSLELEGLERPMKIEARLPASFRAVERARPASLEVAVLAALEARTPLLTGTDCFRWLDGAADSVRDLRVERLADVALVLKGQEGLDVPRELLAALLENGAKAVVERVRPKDPREGEAASVRTLAGELASPRFTVSENGLRYQVDLQASVTSTGIFLDQREARRRIASMPLSGKTVLNGFAHAGAFSVAAAAAGAITTSVDLSKRYLEWAKENLAANGQDPGRHDFIYGDALEWLRRLGKKGRRFDLVILDPPSFSTTKKGKAWSAARDLGSLVALGLSCLAPGGTLYVSTNQRGLAPRRFEELVRAGFEEAGRALTRLELGTLPLDFRTVPGELPYLKTAWAS